MEPPGESRRASRKESMMETAGGGDDVGGIRYYYHRKNLPGYSDGASRVAGKRLFPGRPGSKFWIAGKILSDFFRSRLFWHIFPNEANKIRILETEQPRRQSEGNFNCGFMTKTYPAVYFPNIIPASSSFTSNSTSCSISLKTL